MVLATRVWVAHCTPHRETGRSEQGPARGTHFWSQERRCNTPRHGFATFPALCIFCVQSRGTPGYNRIRSVLEGLRILREFPYSVFEAINKTLQSAMIRVK